MTIHVEYPIVRYRIRPDSTVPLEDLIRLGCYDFVSPLITRENFGDTCSQIVETSILLAHFSYHHVDVNEIPRVFKSVRLRSVNLSELLWLGVFYPELQRAHLVSAASAVYQDFRGRRYIAALQGNSLRRSLSARSLDADTNCGWHFAVVE